MSVCVGRTSGQATHNSPLLLSISHPQIWCTVQFTLARWSLRRLRPCSGGKRSAANASRGLQLCSLDHTMMHPSAPVAARDYQSDWRMDGGEDRCEGPARVAPSGQSGCPRSVKGYLQRHDLKNCWIAMARGKPSLRGTFVGGSFVLQTSRLDNVNNSRRTELSKEFEFAASDFVSSSSEYQVYTSS